MTNWIRCFAFFEPCVYMWVCFVLGMLLWSSCPLAGLSMMLLQPWRLCVSALFMLSQHPTGCLLSVVCLLFLTTLICLCAMFSLNSAPDQTQAIECCQFLSAWDQTFFSTHLALRKNPRLCLYIHASHSPLICILCEICSYWIKLLLPSNIWLSRKPTDFW